ncbi:hypothetical protein [Pseudomonas sp. PLMAX]|uniref:ADP-ribosyltransferase-containing protein n=1 Tax=Pseudomonas sp. PLMAX TaxID=2201998 RepID=UPI0038B8B504
MHPNSAQRSRYLRTDLPAFKQWFDGSKVVTEAGAPKMVFHGTPNDFSVFDTFPAYFTCDRDAAMAYACSQYAREGHDGDPTVMSVYLAMKNPRVISADELMTLAGDEVGEIDWTSIDNLAYMMEVQGFDGLILQGVTDFSGMDAGERQTREYDQYVAFNAQQIKVVVEKKPRPEHEIVGPEL